MNIGIFYDGHIETVRNVYSPLTKILRLNKLSSEKNNFEYIFTNKETANYLK